MNRVTIPLGLMGANLQNNNGSLPIMLKSNYLHEFDFYNKIWQAFCVLLPLKTVGVMGDKRTYEHVVCLRMVTSLDGMTADWYKMPPEVLEICSNIRRISLTSCPLQDSVSHPNAENLS